MLLEEKADKSLTHVWLTEETVLSPSLRALGLAFSWDDSK